MKRIYPALILLTLLLSACSGAPATRTGASIPTVVLASPTASPTPAPTIVPPTSTPFASGCQVTSLLPAPASTIPPVTAGDWSRGPASAQLTIVEYSDFQCPYCAQLDPVLTRVLAANPQDLRLVYRHYPLNIHDKARTAAQAAEAAGVQGKFWEMHDALFASQDTWTNMTMDDFVAWLSAQAKTLGLDVVKFNADLVAPEIVKKVQDAQVAGENLGLPGTPFLMMNGLFLGDQVDEASLTYIIDLLRKVYALEPKRVQECPPLTIDKTKQYIATLNTTRGDIVIQLYPDKAPLAVNSFVFLAQRGWFDGDPFHRVIANFIAQSGDPSGTGIGNPGYFLVNEPNDLKFDKPGVVGLANSGANTNGSQFFITLAAQPDLDGKYTIFGQVIQGMDVVQKLTLRDPQQGGTLPVPDLINKVTIEVK